MTRIKILAVSAVLALPSLPEAAYASSGSLKCGRHIISAGTSTQYEVLKKCGEPTSRLGNTWIYEKPGAAPRQITFDASGRVMFIERLGR